MEKNQTQIKQLQDKAEDLKERLTLLEKILNSLNLPIVVWELIDPNDTASFTLVYANQEVEKHGGGNFNDHLGKKIFEALPQLDKNVPNLYKQVLDEQKYKKIYFDVFYSDDRSSAQSQNKIEVHAFPLTNNQLLVQFALLKKIFVKLPN